MKIEQITVENFGIYARKTFHFGAAPLILIYGPNESGKTTALNAIRQAMCGFRVRTPYLLTGRTMAAQVQGRMRDGGLLEFQRRKGRPDEVHGSLDGKRVQGEDIRQLLGDLDLESYEELFGFSLDELRKGEDALKNARLSDALAGGGLAGMTALQKLRSDLDESLAMLFKKRGSNQKINQKLIEIERSHEALRQVQVLPSAVDELRGQLQVAQERSDQLKQEYAAVFNRLKSAEQTVQSLPLYREHVTLQSQIAQTQIPDGVDSAFVAQWSDVADRRQATETMIDEESRQLSEDRSKLDSLGGVGDVFHCEREIESVGHVADEIAAQRSRLVELYDQHEDAQGECRRLLENLELPEVTEHVRQFSISAPARRELESLSENYATLSDELLQVSAKLDAAHDTLATIAEVANVDDLPDNLPDLASCLSRLVERDQEFQQKSAALNQHLQDREFAALGQRLSEVSGGLAPSKDWLVPSASAMSEAAKEHQQLRRTRELLEQQITDQKRKLDVARDELDLHRQHSTASASMERITMLCTERDRLLSDWLDDLAEPLIAASLTPDRQTQRLAQLQVLLFEADEQVRQCLAAADGLAKTHHQEQAVAKFVEQLAEAERSLAKVDEDTFTFESRWLALWEQCGFKPGPPDVMLAWRNDFLRWLAVVETIGKTRRELHVARSLVRQQRAELQDIWPQSLREDVPISVLQQCLRGWETADRDRSRDRSRWNNARDAVATLEVRISELRRAKQDVANRYAAWLQAAPVANWPVEQLTNLLDSLERLRREDLNAHRLRQQMRSLETQLADYQAAVQSLAVKLKQHAGSGPPELAAKRWLQELQANREQQTLRVRLSSAIEHRSRRLAELKKQQDSTDKRLAALCSAAGGNDPASMGTLMQRVRLADQWRSRLSEIAAALEAIRGSERKDLFWQVLAESDESHVQLEVGELGRDLTKLDAARKDADEQVGALTERIEFLANSQTAQQHLQSLQNHRGELAELTEQWLVESLAQQLLLQSIDRFAAENEPAMLRLTRKYLTELTGGRYVSIEHDGAGSGGLIVRSSSDEGFEPSRLSTGTREQLYLAIRMAYITHYSEHHEALPVIMDDCFVNFDDERARLAIQSLLSWDASRQVILLSCHWRLIQILAKVAPETPVMQLDQDISETAADIVFAANPKQVSFSIPRS